MEFKSPSKQLAHELTQRALKRPWVWKQFCEIANAEKEWDYGDNEEDYATYWYRSSDPEEDVQYVIGLLTVLLHPPSPEKQQVLDEVLAALKLERRDA